MTQNKIFMSCVDRITAQKTRIAAVKRKSSEQEKGVLDRFLAAIIFVLRDDFLDTAHAFSCSSTYFSYSANVRAGADFLDTAPAFSCPS